MACGVCVRIARYVMFLRESRVERSRVVNELTGDGNVEKETEQGRSATPRVRSGTGHFEAKTRNNRL
jgi:hypothetical protein